MQRDFLLRKKTGLPLHAIAAEVCEQRHISRVDFFSKRRFRAYAHARQEFCYRARYETTASLPEIANLLDWDHTSVIYAVRKHEARISKLSTTALPDDGVISTIGA